MDEGDFRCDSCDMIQLLDMDTVCSFCGEGDFCENCLEAHEDHCSERDDLGRYDLGW